MTNAEQTGQAGAEVQASHSIDHNLKQHALAPRRKSALILGSLASTIVLIAIAIALTLTDRGSPNGIAALNAGAILATIVTTWVIVRLGSRITELKLWIRRMGAGDLDHTVPPRGHDELTEIAYELEVLRQHSLSSQELDLVRELSGELQDKNEALENTLTELRNTQDQMISKQKLAEIGELTAGIAHEVRNPLNIISNYATTSRSLMSELMETMAEEDTDPVERDELISEITSDLTANMERIAENCDRANRIIQDVTSMSRSQTSEARPTDFNKMLHDYAILAYQAIRAQDQEFNVSFVENMAEDVGEVVCVPEQISRVFINIASNACYAANQKRLVSKTDEDFKPTIWLSSERAGDIVTAIIRDNGDGIPDDIVDKIFNPFFTTKPTDKGTGLGLSLSHDIVRHHSGNIVVKSEPGHYTEMRVELPARPLLEQAPPE